MPKFVPRQRKHKVLARRKASKHTDENNGDAANQPVQDSNQAVILPAEQQARELRKQALKDELAQQASVERKMSGKKRKRLDKYIDTKLKKEENLALLKKLAAHKVDTTLFRSSTKLGRGGQETQRERAGRAVREIREGVDVDANTDVLFEKRRIVSDDEDGSDDQADDVGSPEAHSKSTPSNGGKPSSESSEQIHTSHPSSTAPARSPIHQPPDEGTQAVSARSVASFGGGLKRPLETDEAGKPIIQTRKRRKGAGQVTEIEAEVEWEGFSSDADSEDVDEAAESLGGGQEGSDASEVSDEEGDSGDSDSELDDSEESDESGSEARIDTDAKTARKERASVFKAWATQQRNEAIGFVPSQNLESVLPAKNPGFVPRAPENDPLPLELESATSTDATRKAYSVTVHRTPDIQEARLQLPVVAEEQKIMEAIHNHDVVVVWGATGSGKTTQVPQFLYEAGYGAPDGPTPGMIGVTQPRRVAAVSMSKRVGDELGSEKSKVAYQIRFDATTSASTAIKFMTDGVLLREITQDFVLSRYSAIVIDEAHQRSVNTDILIGMLSRIVDLRADMARKDVKTRRLKLIIMSATLRIADFTDNLRLFRHGPPPLMKAEGRQYTVTNHFARRTERDYVEEMFKKVSRGHRKLPRGGMLVFLTGQNEITHLAKRLRQAFSSTHEPESTAKVSVTPSEAAIETEDLEIGNLRHDVEDEDGSDSEGSVITGLDGEEDEDFQIDEAKPEEVTMKVHVLPLYSQLPTNQQLRIFEPPPDGSRLIVLATNVAETSLTIPGIRYVFDCGRAKEKKYDPITGVQSFEIGWISQASANQRAGRAGRTGPGHCYRLYSSAVFERDFTEYAEPEIMRTPLEGIVLQLRSMGAPVTNFPFPTPPDQQSLQKAEKLLSHLGALSEQSAVTKLGHELSLYPLSPRFARMLVMGVSQGLVAESIALVAALSVPELVVSESKLGLREPPSLDPDTIRTEQDNLEAEQRSRSRKSYNAAQAKLAVNANQSDCIKLNNAVCAYAHAANSDVFCEDMYLNAKAMHEAAQLRQQLTSIVRTHRPNSIGSYSAKLPPPSEKTINLLTQIAAAGFIDQIAMRADLAPTPPSLPRKPKTAIDVPYLTLFRSQDTICNITDDPSAYVYLHPSSILARTPPAKLPAYIVYSHLQRSAASTIPSAISGSAARQPKTRLHPLTPVTRPQIINIALNTPLLQVGKPRGKITELSAGEREAEVELSLVGERGTQGWGLGIRRIVQRKEGGAAGGRWVVEKVVG